MPGIVTSSGGSGSVKTYRALFTSTSTSLAINWVTGTTASSTSNCLPADKGVFVVFQNQSSAANVTIGGSDVTPNVQGIVLTPTSTSAATQGMNMYEVFIPSSASGIQMTDWYVTTTSSVGEAVAQLIKFV